MINLSSITGFEWDEWNVDKSYKKHSITPNEAEEAFLDKDLLVQEDIKHSEKEERFSIVGKIIKGDILFVVFSLRNNKIRVISARKASKKERRQYEQKP